MRQPLAVLLVVVASVLAASPAHGTASATVTVNGTSRTLSETGFLFEQIIATGVNLAPGQSADFTFDYSVSVQDSGLPAAFDQKAVGCTSIFPSTCNDAYTGFEYAKVYLVVFQEDPRVVHNPALVQTGVSGGITLATHGDSFAESLAQSGTLQAHISNGDLVTTYSHVYPTFVALWVLANPIPEPAVVAQMLVGLGLIGIAINRRGAARGRRRIKETNSWQPFRT